MRFAALISLLLTGCHHLRVGPQFQRSPEITCIVVMQGGASDETVVKAIQACKEEEQKGKPQ
jgi:hypothetical protein